MSLLSSVRWTTRHGAPAYQELLWATGGFSVFFLFLSSFESINRQGKSLQETLGPRRSAAAEEKDPFAEDNAPVRGAAFCDMYLLEEINNSPYSFGI